MEIAGVLWHVGQREGGGNIGHTFGVDGTDERSLTEALLWGRKSLLEYEHYYKEYLEGFEGMTLLATGALLGLRETRRIMGDYILCLDDFKNRAVFDDEIGRYNYPVDIHASSPSNEDFAKFEEIWGRRRIEKLQRNIIQTPLVDISSTEIRNRIASEADTGKMLHPAVADYIRKNGLYQSKEGAGLG